MSWRHFPLHLKAQCNKVSLKNLRRNKLERLIEPSICTLVYSFRVRLTGFITRWSTEVSLFTRVKHSSLLFNFSVLSWLVLHRQTFLSQYNNKATNYSSVIALATDRNKRSSLLRPGTNWLKLYSICACIEGF
jgi:hypothetical protein